MCSMQCSGLTSVCLRAAAWQSAADSPLVSTTALRLQQGMPLVSTEKLPRWAIQASKAAAQQGPPATVASDGGSGAEQAQARQLPADSRWAQQSPVGDCSERAGTSQVSMGGPSNDGVTRMQALLLAIFRNIGWELHSPDRYLTLLSATSTVAAAW